MFVAVTNEEISCIFFFTKQGSNIKDRSMMSVGEAWYAYSQAFNVVISVFY